VKNKTRSFSFAIEIKNATDHEGGNVQVSWKINEGSFLSLGHLHERKKESRLAKGSQSDGK